MFYINKQYEVQILKIVFTLSAAQWAENVFETTIYRQVCYFYLKVQNDWSEGFDHCQWTILQLLVKF